MTRVASTIDIAKKARRCFTRTGKNFRPPMAVPRAVEAHSNMEPWQSLTAERGAVLCFLPITPEGRLDLDRLDSEVSERCRLIALTHCSNVTGALTDVARVVAAARAARAAPA
jgi:selenocysteine lyase/cysteine desulfurase